MRDLLHEDFRTDPLYNRIKKEIWDLAGRIPSVGEGVRVMVGRIDESLKNLLTPGVLFEELGFRYIGPIDGHNLEELVTTLRNLKPMKGPILLHTITEKGKGMNGVEKDPQRYHSVGPVSAKVVSGPSPPKYTDVFGQTMIELAERDPRVIAITAAMSSGTGLDAFARRFPERFFDVGIAEQHAVTFAAGLALEGGRPVAAIYSTFLQRAYDQIIHDVALQSIPVVFALDRGGLAGEDGPTHHGAFDLSYLSCIPNMIVAAPKDGDELRDLLYTAVVQKDRPFAIRYPKDSTTCVTSERPPHVIPVGSYETLIEGNGLVIIAIGAMVATAREVARQLQDEGCQIGVVNGRFVKPLDIEMLGRLAREYEIVVTVEENVLQGGLGDAVAKGLATLGFDDRVRLYQIGLPDAFIEHGPRKRLLNDVGLS
ncbi:MAG: 1-deoxy-D-xylulose-5-phosphate synthase, partial [Candidatus Latescibacteria bacterium]|nr:1-deoxy-D-xylulose-5-phosphate synthase [Candidatus Latescibacterota bacterium]